MDYILERKTKLSLFLDDMIIYLEYPKETPQSTTNTCGTNKQV